MRKALSVLLVVATLLASVSASGLRRGTAASLPPVQGTNGMVASAQHLASAVGVRVLQQGGNAIDAAVAVGYALAVVHPCCGNIGGGGFMTIHLANGKDTFLNFREKAPGAATRDMYLDKQGRVIPGLSTDSYLAVGVPGTVLGLDTALREYGTMSRARVMAPAIALARDGFVLQQGDVNILDQATTAFAKQPNVAAVFLDNGKPYRAGDRLTQRNLAHTLELVSRNGPDAFYKGPIADAIVAASRAHHGLLTKADLAGYTVEEEQPARSTYRGYGIISAPPPSSGGTTLGEILNILEGYPMGRLGFHSAANVHYMVEAMRHAYVDRNTYLGDPDFVKNPLSRLLSKTYAAHIRGEIAASHATPSRAVKPGLGPVSVRATSLQEGNETTQYSIVDKRGNAVSVTYTINFLFGVKMIPGNTGFFLNDEMDDFTSKPGVANGFGLVQGAANAIAPGKRPLSSMSPTIVTRNGKVFMVIGSPGGSRIITITQEAIQNVVDYGMNIQEAIDAPRVHHQWLPDTVYLEPFALSPDTMSLLKGMGYSFTRTGATWGSAEGIVIDPVSGLLYGANDSRTPAGAAIGY